MCGIVGIIKLDGGTMPDAAVDFFEQLLFHDTIRGPHSTGVFAYTSKNIVHVIKEALPGPAFLTSDKWTDSRKQLHKTPVRAIFGHNRWATVGNVTDDNAHPFHHDDIILMHNGTLLNKDQLNAEVEVDSSALAHAIAAGGWEKAINSANGSWALSWFNLAERSVNILRNHQRPLAVAKASVAGEHYHVFASETNMLEWLLDRSRLFHMTSVSDVSADILNKYTYEEEGWKLNDVPLEPAWKKQQRLNMENNGWQNQYLQKQHNFRGSRQRYIDGQWRVIDSHGGVGAIVPEDTGKPICPLVPIVPKSLPVTPVTTEADKSLEAIAADYIGRSVNYTWYSFTAYSNNKRKAANGRLLGYPVSLYNTDLGGIGEYDVVMHDVPEGVSKALLNDSNVYTSVITGIGKDALGLSTLLIKEHRKLDGFKYNSADDKVEVVYQDLVLATDEAEFSYLMDTRWGDVVCR